ncbi:unnamed protein product [Gadus morhua 'NCC']
MAILRIYNLSLLKWYTLHRKFSRWHWASFTNDANISACLDCCEISRFTRRQKTSKQSRAMEKKRGASHQYGALECTQWTTDIKETEGDAVSMADSSVTKDDIEGELFKIERIRDVLVRRESELRYMMDDIQLCKEITRLKKELQKLVSIPDKDKSAEDRQREEQLLLQIHKLVETRDYLVEDVEFERLREREEDKEMAEFLKTKFPENKKKGTVPVRRGARRAPQQPSSPFTKTGLSLLKECCGFTCSVM